MKNKLTHRTADVSGRDFYKTPAIVTAALFNSGFMQWTSNSKFLDPCCGTGCITKIIAKNTKNYQAFDLHYYGNNEVKNFLADEVEPADIIVMNPPYNFKNDFIRRALEVIILSEFSRLQPS